MTDLDVAFDPARRAALAAAGGALLSGPSARYKTPAGRPTSLKTVSVMDHIPPDLHDLIRNGRCTTDLSRFFQAATVVANGGEERGEGSGGIVFIPAGTYPVAGIGIRDTIVVGEHRQGSRIVAASPTGGFLLDAMLDRDGGTANTAGNGYACNLTIDAAHSGASGLRTYGGGCAVQNLTIVGARTGLAAGLPIWSTFSNIHVVDCVTGFHTFAQQPGDSGTSSTFLDCWANRCKRYGFHLTQLMYSSLINCAAQESGDTNFYVEGDANASPAAYSLQFIGCGTEGGGKPFYLRKCRDLTLVGARVIAPDAGVDHITFDDSAGSIRDFSTVGPPRRPALSLRLVNHGAPPGGVLVDGSIVVTDPASEAFYTIVGGSVNGRVGLQTPALHLSGELGAATAQLELAGPAAALAWRSGQARLAAFPLQGGTILSAPPSGNLAAALDADEVGVSLTPSRNGLRFLFKDRDGATRMVEIQGRIVD